jgi:mutual gliding-motility protein MglA
VVFFNYTTMQMTAKIVYYGPGLCGKTTNLQFIHHKTAAQSRGEMVSLETETDRTLFFDLLPLDVGIVGGMKLRLQLYTVPGQVFYNATRKLVLKGVDGIVFVADSQLVALDANVESLNNLKTNLDELRTNFEQVPIVFQYNKRDIRNILPVERLNEALNPTGLPFFEAAALHGVGVFETLKAISKQSITAIRRKLSDEKKPASSAPAAKAAPAAAKPAAPAAKPAAAKPAAGKAASAAPRPAPAKPAPAAAPEPDPTPAPPPPVVAAPPPEPEPEWILEAEPDQPAPADGDDLLQGLVPDLPPAEEVPLEFAEEDTDEHRVRPVQTKASTDILRELEGLRTLTANANTPKATAARQIDKRLQDLLIPDPGAKQEVKRKATVEVPASLLKGAADLKVQVTFVDGDGQTVHEAVTVPLGKNKRLERLMLHLDLEIKGKA